MKQPHVCTYCKQPLNGRVDKRFCNPHCKSAFHYRQERAEGVSEYARIDKQLKKNRKLLRRFNQAGKATIRADELISAGFDPNYFTNYWKSEKGDVYLFCYEYGFLKRKELGKIKFVLVKWQAYMSK